ncbi:MAG: CotH kinase family protein, partial [Lachnospiraceae bacterium]|nr:CotH kinase family protein [Lachnospiraceae bacterium]
MGLSDCGDSCNFLCVRSERTNITIQMDAKGNLSAIINHNHNVDRIKPFYNAEEAIYYFFFPSYVDEQRVYLGDALDAKENIYVGGEQVYSVLAAENCYQMVFLCSNNLPTLFIDIDDQSMERIHADKENQDAGMLTVYSSLGEREYDGKFDKLSGRGNSTWARNKKSYNLSLHKEAPLCGLDKGKKWVLMSLVFEDTKMNNMIALDFAHELGMKYTSQATWVDLYINGDYRGIYLLLETVTCADGRVEINKNKDSFLIEKEIPERCDEAEQIFSTQRGKTFVLHYPKSASNEEIRSVEERISQIESGVYDGTPDFENQMDMDSFASYYLVDEITNQIDFELSSMYFYQKSANGKLYAGPIWDYDNSFGAYYPDYTASVLEHENMDLEEYKQDYLHWYGLLMQNEQFESYVREKYEICQPYFSELLQSKIDNWAEYIQQAVYMDSVRWRNLESETRYGDFEQDVRYLKFYLGNRLASINERWGVAS